MKVRPLRVDEAEKWNTFVEGHPLGAVEQTWTWGELQIRVPGRIAFQVFAVFEEGRIVGGMLVIRQVMGLGKTWLWCPKGPLLPKAAAADAWEVLKKACETLDEGDVFLRIESCFGAESLIRGKEVKTRYIPGNTLILDLLLSEEKLLAGMSQGTRRNLRIAKKMGVKVAKGTLEDIGVFYKILEDTAGRDGFRVHEEKFYRQFLELLCERADLWLAKLNGKVVGGALMVTFGKTTTYYFGASSSETRETKVGHALQWHAICEAKKSGAKFYDFLGVAPEGDAGDGLAKVTQFKLGFGGERVAYQKSQVFVYQKVWWVLYAATKKFKAWWTWF